MGTKGYDQVHLDNQQLHCPQVRLCHSVGCYEHACADSASDKKFLCRNPAAVTCMLPS